MISFLIYDPITSGVPIIDYDKKIGLLFLFQWQSSIISQIDNLRLFRKYSLSECFVFRMYVLQTRDIKLSFSKHKTDIDSSRSWRLAQRESVRLYKIL